MQRVAFLTQSTGSHGEKQSKHAEHRPLPQHICRLCLLRWTATPKLISRPKADRGQHAMVTRTTARGNQHIAWHNQLVGT